MGSTKTKIVFYRLCHSATRFSTQSKAEVAAAAYGQQARYQCEAFYCGKEHEIGSALNRRTSGPCFHVRPKTWMPPAVRTGESGRQFQLSSVSAEQLDRAMSFDIDDLLSGISK
jgi:hypothetical protein